MRFVLTGLDGLFVVELERLEDERDSFARVFCSEEFAAVGPPITFRHCNTSVNRRRGPVRGLHWQDEPHPEIKPVRCTRGAIWDVAVDLRPVSPTLER